MHHRCDVNTTRSKDEFVSHGATPLTQTNANCSGAQMTPHHKKRAPLAPRGPGSGQQATSSKQQAASKQQQQQQQQQQRQQQRQFPARWKITGSALVCS